MKWVHSCKFRTQWWILILNFVHNKSNRLDAKLGTATPYGCNDKIDGIYILSSPTCRLANVMDIFNSAPWRKRSHGHRYYTSPIFHDVSLNDLLPFMQKPLGMHLIRSKLFSLLLSKLHALFNSCLVKQCYKSEFKWIQTYSNRLGYCWSQTFQTCWY